MCIRDSESSKLPDGTVEPIFSDLGREFVYRTCGVSKHGPESALPVPLARLRTRMIGAELATPLRGGWLPRRRRGS
eukprot:1115472-Alexandrium_andersonii.AAC.1